MAQMIVRNIDDEVAERFKARAKAQGKSAEQLLREIMAREVQPNRREVSAFAAEMRRRTAERRPTVDAVAAIRHDRDTDHGRRRGHDNHGDRHGTDHRPQS